MGECVDVFCWVFVRGYFVVVFVYVVDVEYVGVWWEFDIVRFEV